MKRFTIDDRARLAFSSLHVAGVGHGVGGARAGACRFRRRASGDAARRDLAAARADPRRRAGRLADEVHARRAATAGRSSSTTTPIPTSTTRRSSCSRCSKAAIAKRLPTSVERARRWTLAMDSRNGAWAAFDRDNTRELLYRMPFSDFGAMIDPPTEDVTAHVLEMLAALGDDATNPLRRARLDVFARNAEARGVRGSAAGASTTSTERGASSRRSPRCETGQRHDRARRRLAALGAKCRRRLGRNLPLVRRRVVRRASARARPRRPPGRSWRCNLPGFAQHPGGRSGSRVPVRAPARRRHLGRAGVHRNGLPARLLHQLPSLPASLSDDGPCDERESVSR